MKCIYCLKKKADEKFKSREHVVPQSFGVFHNNLTLHKIVCDNCNNFFGNHLELYLARDSYEGAMRYDFKICNPQNIKSMGKKSGLIIKVEEEPFKGAFAFREFSEKQDKLVIKPLPQIGFLEKGTNNYHYYLLLEIPEKDSLSQEKYDLHDPKGMRILGCDIQDAERELSEKGFQFKFGGEIETDNQTSDDLLCEIEWHIDDTLKRAIAKIGLNYFVYWMGADLVSHRSFHPIKRYIRYGEKYDYPLVAIDNQPILSDETQEGKARLGHIVTINWASDGFSILSQVSILNMFRYSVSLAKNYSRLYKPFKIKKGSFFNVATGDIYEIQ